MIKPLKKYVYDGKLVREACRRKREKEGGIEKGEGVGRDTEDIVPMKVRHENSMDYWK